MARVPRKALPAHYRRTTNPPPPRIVGRRVGTFSGPPRRRGAQDANALARQHADDAAEARRVTRPLDFGIVACVYTYLPCRRASTSSKRGRAPVWRPAAAPAPSPGTSTPSCDRTVCARRSSRSWRHSRNADRPGAAASLRASGSSGRRSPAAPRRSHGRGGSRRSGRMTRASVRSRSPRLGAAPWTRPCQPGRRRSTDSTTARRAIRDAMRRGDGGYRHERGSSPRRPRRTEPARGRAARPNSTNRSWRRGLHLQRPSRPHGPRTPRTMGSTKGTHDRARYPGRKPNHALPRRVLHPVRRRP